MVPERLKNRFTCMAAIFKKLDTQVTPVTIADPLSKRMSFRGAHGCVKTTIRIKGRWSQCQCDPLNRGDNSSNILASH
ncbi:hypothetical protein Hanom_Chr12g01174641 [Helianthus anomalus]